MIRPITLALFAALAACGAPAPELPRALPPQAAAGVTGGLEVPARLGLVRVSGGSVTPVPAAEFSRWRGAMREANGYLDAPVRLGPVPTPATAAAGAEEDEGLPGAVRRALARARAAGLDGLLVYELSVRVENSPATAALAALPLVGGVVPVTAMSEGSGRAVALLVGRDGALIGHARARMAGAAIAPVRAGGAWGADLRPLGEYAMLNALAPKAEDMIVGAVAAAR